MAIVLFDTAQRKRLYPFTYNRAVADIRVGIFTSKERWSVYTNEQVFVCTEPYLQSLYEAIPTGSHWWIDASVMADSFLVKKVLTLSEDVALVDEKGIVAVKTSLPAEQIFRKDLTDRFTLIDVQEKIQRLEYPWQIFQLNEATILKDFAVITRNRTSAAISSTNHLLNEESIFVEAGASVAFATLNASTGPIYIGKNAVIMEGSLLRGPLALCDNAVLKMGAKIYGATTLGPCCVGGGEIKNVVMQGYSNKAHDGYLGDSVIGSWCNLGAGTSNSNVKNTGSNVKIWNPEAGMLTKVGQKCGLIMGDYSRTTINTSMNTGSYVGICCNVFDNGFPPTMIPNFTWGGKGLTRYEFQKALLDIANWKKMKSHTLSNEEASVLKYIFENFLN